MTDSPAKRPKRSEYAAGADDMQMASSDARGRLRPHLNADLRACKEIAERGYTVVTVMPPEQADTYTSMVWDDLEALSTGINRNDPSTWNVGFPQQTHGLVQNQGSGLWLSVCAARSATEAFFQRFYNCTSVLSSWDAFALCKPSYQNYCHSKGPDKHVPEVAEWLHTDQARGKPDLLHHIQGALALTDLVPGIQRTQLVGPCDGETAQQFRDRFLAAFPPPKEEPTKGFDAEREEWIKHTPEEKQWLVNNGRVVLPVVKKGQMLLWASGIPHASWVDEMPYGMKERHPRLSVFISMIPSELLGRNEIHFRRKLLDKGVTSGHRVCEKGKKDGTYRQCVFGRTGRSYGKNLPDYKLGMVQADFNRYDKLTRGDARVDELAPSAVHRATARICGGYDV